jgi:transforming growth factor-beta-induced protein
MKVLTTRLLLSVVLWLSLGSFLASAQSVVDIIANDASLSTLESAFSISGIDSVFLSTANFTLFAPTDDAFATADPDWMITNYLEPAWVIHLRYLLSNHVVEEEIILAAELTDGLQLETTTSLATGLDPLMVTVVLDDAGSSSVFLSGMASNMSMVTEADLVASNGIVHKVDQVLLPGVLALSLYEFIADVGRYTILISLLDSYGLASIVQTETLTLLAPPDDFLAAIPDGALDEYNMTEILLNHVILGDPIPSDFILNGGDNGGYSVTTAAGNSYTLTTVNGTFFVDDIAILSADNPGSNGIFHTLGGVLLPSLVNTTTGNGTDVSMGNATVPPLGNVTGGNATEPPTALGNLVEVAAADATLSTWVTAVNVSGLSNVLAFLELTVFAPTNDAFAIVSQELLAKYLTPAWGAHLRFLLANHMVEGVVLSTGLANGTLLNTRLSITTGVDAVEVSVVSSGGGGDGSVVVRLSGEAFNGSHVIEADILASNGVIHKVDQVLMPSILVSTMYDVIALDGFKTMTGLIDSNGLDGIFKNDTITAFGVPDTVFRELAAGTLDGYNVTEVLLNHVIMDVIPSNVMVMMDEGFTFTTAAGYNYTVTVVNSSLTIGNVKITFPDVAVSNGVIHILNSVLLPPFKNATSTERPMTLAPTVTPVPLPTRPPTLVGGSPTAVPGSAGSSRSGRSTMVGAALLLLSSWSGMLLLLLL